MITFTLCTSWFSFVLLRIQGVTMTTVAYKCSLFADHSILMTSPLITANAIHCSTLFQFHRRYCHISSSDRPTCRAAPDLFFSNPTGAGFCQIWNDKSDWSRIFKLTNFTNLMCKTLQMYEWFDFLIIFCAAVTVTTFLISGFLIIRPTRLSYNSSKLSDVWEKSTFQIRQNYPAPVGFLEPDFCLIWKSAGFWP